MVKPDNENSGNSRYYVELFLSVFRRTMWDTLEYDIVCMECRRYIPAGEGITDECCKTMGFQVDPSTVVIDKATGKTTQASPVLKEDIESDK